MSLSKEDKLIRVAVIEGNVALGKLIRTLQPSPVEGVIACTDGKVIYIGEEFWHLPLAEQYFIINHEFLHIILKHHERRGDRHPVIYNIAADVIINKILLDRGRTLPPGACTYDSMSVPEDLITTNEVYDYLIQRNPDTCDFQEDIIPELSDDIPEEIIKEVKKLAEGERNSTYSKEVEKEKITSVPQDFTTKVDWFNDLMLEIGRLAIRTIIKTYNRPPRIKVPGCIMKGGYISQYIPKINIIIDVSFSMEENPLKIAAKINAMKDYLKVFQPDYYWLNESWGVINDITKIPLGGGTDLSNAIKINKADLNVLITDCEDDSGVDAINNSAERFYIVTNSSRTGIIQNHNHKVFFTNEF